MEKIRRLIRQSLIFMMNWVAARPRLSRFVIRNLERSPRLKRRLAQILLPIPDGATPDRSSPHGHPRLDRQPPLMANSTDSDILYRRLLHRLTFQERQ